MLLHRYGFKGRPTLDLSAKPKLGHREVTIHYITEWIESKLKEVVEVSNGCNVIHTSIWSLLWY